MQYTTYKYWFKKIESVTILLINTSISTCTRDLLKHLQTPEVTLDLPQIGGCVTKSALETGTSYHTKTYNTQLALELPTRFTLKFAPLFILCHCHVVGVSISHGYILTQGLTNCEL